MQYERMLDLTALNAQILAQNVIHKVKDDNTYTFEMIYVILDPNNACECQYSKVAMSYARQLFTCNARIE